MSEILKNLGDTIEKMDKIGEAYEVDNDHPVLKSGLGNFGDTINRAFSGDFSFTEGPTESHKTKAEKEPEVEVLRADSVVNVDGTEINL